MEIVAAEVAALAFKQHELDKAELVSDLVDRFNVIARDKSYFAEVFTIIDDDIRGAGVHHSCACIWAFKIAMKMVEFDEEVRAKCDEQQFAIYIEGIAGDVALPYCDHVPRSIDVSFAISGESA